VKESGHRPEGCDTRQRGLTSGCHEREMAVLVCEIDGREAHSEWGEGER
jgi:hypothetical protein